MALPSANVMMSALLYSKGWFMRNFCILSFIALLAVVSLPIPLRAAEEPMFIKTSAADRTEARAFRPTVPTGRRAKLGLALGGGGARGAAEVGVLKVLMKEGLKFDYVVGTSIGAVVGGFYCLGATAEQMEEAFESGAVMRHFMAVPLSFRIAASPILILPRVLGLNHGYDGLYGGDTFRKYLIGNMTVHEQLIENLKPEFAAVSLNVIEGKPYMIRRGNLGYAMQASSAVPSLRKPVEINGQLFCDGGVICNLPVKQCRELGADMVIAVNIDEPFDSVPLDALRQPGSMTERMVCWGLFDIDDPQSQMADITIHPDTKGISLISTKKKDARRGVANGEKAALDALPLIRKKLAEYGITPGAQSAAPSPP